MGVMSTKVHCPNCQEPLDEEQLKKLWAEYCGKKKSTAKSKAAIKNGSKGGRPMTYFQDVYDAIPNSVELVRERRKERKEEHNFDVTVETTADPVLNGFDLRCQDIYWHCTWNGITEYIDISENGQPRSGIGRINNAAKTAAKKLVEDIHREKLFRMAPDHESMIEKIYKQTGQRLNLNDILPS